MNKNLIYGIIAGVVFLLIFSYFSLGLNQNGSDENENGAENASIREVEDGVTVQITEDGEGDPVETGDTVVVHYNAYLEDPENPNEKGENFYSVEKEEIVLGSGQVIEGLDKGIVGMTVGETRTIFIPAEQAYGEAGSGPIPPNANIIFDVELLEIK